MKFQFLYKKSIAIFIAGILSISSLHTPYITKASNTSSATASTDDSIDAETNDQANSFRYQNGIPIQTKNKYVKTSTSAAAWTKVDGSYVNDVGNIIPNAVARGVDVSHYQGKIDWENVKQSDVDFAIIHCGYGQDFTKQDDPYWFANADACTENNIPFGTYLYSYATTTEKAVGEANHVLRLIKGYNLSYPIYYDLENNSLGKLSEKQLAAIAKAFCDTIEEAGYKAAIYASKDWFTNKLTNSAFDNWDRWVAQYNSTCTYTKPYSMWQCTNVANISGIETSADLNFIVQSEPLVPVTAITVSSSAIQMKPAETKKMNAAVFPLNSFEKKIIYVSSDTTIAAIDENGIITAGKEGVATITAKSVENPSIMTSCTVTVNHTSASNTPITTTPAAVETPIVTITPPTIEPSTIPIETISLEKTTLKIIAGNTVSLTAVTNSEKIITWSSSNDSVATVSSTGKVTAIAPGKAVITAAINDTVSVSCSIYVKPDTIKEVDFTAISTNKLMLTWKKTDDVSGYAIYRYDTKNKKYRFIKALSASKQSYTFSKLNGASGSELTAGSKYIFKIAAYKTIDGKKYYGSKVTIKAATRPKKTTLKSLKRKSAATAKAIWSKVSASDGYIIYISNYSSRGYQALLTIDNPKISSYTITGLKKGKTYYIKLCAYRKINGKIVYANYSNIKKLKM